jgi:DNA-binding NarL/FixJ family response regulator
MPDVGGGELVAFVKRFRRRCVKRIVLLSAADEAELARLAKEVGADGYISKTSDTDLLLRSMKEYLPEPDGS